MTRRACVIGWPAAHSRSPMIHGYWLEQAGIEGAYERASVSPDEFPDFVRRLRDHGFVGANVTIPHKEAALRLVDEATETARALGAVNTLWFENGRLRGDNTDVPGFLAHLDASAPGWDAEPGTAMVLGAGGAARAVIFALKSRGLSEIRVVNRTRERAERLAESFGPPVAAFGWEAAEEALAGARLLVNTTSLGMAGQPPLELDLAPLRPDAIVYDIVYVPLETALLRTARARGLRTVDGLGMLLHQAVPGFARWFGITPQVTAELHDLVAADIEGR
ncbi:MAG: shikimate dehydrogenase [Pseudomonadota bacterium]|nr:shikimate dehydrogenase [Pseudomonadota bacterium]